MQAASINWRDRCRDIIFPASADHRLWQIAYFCALVTPYMLVGHRTAADVLCGLIGLLFLLRSSSQRKWEWLRDPIIITLGAAWAWLSLVVTPLAYDIPASASIAFPWIRFIVFYAAMRHWVLTEAQPIKFIGASLAIWLILISVDTLWQYVHGISFTNNIPASSGRLTGPFGNVKVGIYLSRLLLPTLAICLFFSISEKRFKLAIITYSILFFFILSTIAVSGERAPFGVAVIGTLTALSLLMATEQKIRVKCFWIIAAVISMVYLLIMTQDWVHERLVLVINTLMDFRHSSYGQLFWLAYELGTGNLLHGVGLKSFRELCEYFQVDGIVNHCNLHPHNPYFEWFVETGIIGLALFLVFIFQLISSCLKTLRSCSGKYRLIPAFVMGTLVIFFFPFVPTQSFFSNWPAILFWYALSVAMASLSLCAHQRNKISFN